MSIINTDLKLKKSATINDTSGNGGKMGAAASEVTTGVKNNIFQDVSHSERVSGITRYRKLFVHVAPSTTTMLASSRVCVEKHTPGEDAIVMMAGTQNDTQAEADDYTVFYGSGDLNADVSAGATSITVNVEIGNDAAGRAIFHNGDFIRITSRETIESGTGADEIVELATTNAVSWSGTVATLTLKSGVSLANSYATADGSRVASMLSVGDVEPVVSGWSESSASGTFDESIYPVVGTSKGTIQQDWTVTFTSATDFDVTGSVIGAVGSGTTSGDFSPTNTDMSAVYFTLPYLGFAGTWAIGDTIDFTTAPASIPFWLAQFVPAGASSMSGDTVTVAVFGESA